MVEGELRARLQANLLAGRGARSPEEVVRRVVGVQAQAAGPAQLAVRARSSGLTAAGVDQAQRDRAVVKTWAMRGTLHLLAAGDVGWIVGLLGPVNARAGRRRREQLGLDQPTCTRALAALAEILTGSNPLTRAQIIPLLAAAGVRIDPKTQAPPHLLGLAANSGLICRGPDAERDEPTYVLLREWLGDRAANRFERRQDALAELATRYLAGYGPADEADFAAWSGLSRSESRAGWASAATRASKPDRGAAVEPALLGHFDPLLLGYAGRDMILDPGHAKQVQAGGGFIQPTVLVSGRVVGTWKLDRRRRQPVVRVRPFAGRPVESLADEVADLGRFLGEQLELAFD